jgi:hypothetical protein
LERHDAYEDSPELPHVLVVEAHGRGETVVPAVPLIADYARDTEAPFHQLQYAALSLVRLLRRALGRAGRD